MLDSRRQDIAAGTLKAGDDRNAEWIGALEGARWPKPDARSVCRAARRFAHGTAICLRKPERSGELVDGDGWACATRTPRASPDAPPPMRLAPIMATRGLRLHQHLVGCAAEDANLNRLPGYQRWLESMLKRFVGRTHSQLPCPPTGRAEHPD